MWRDFWTDIVPASTDERTGVTSKDITIITKQPEPNISTRLYLPKLTKPNQKLPLLVYFHGGAFCVSSPFNSKYYNYLNALVVESNVVAIFVNYRKAPEHPLPTVYKDAWAALQWAASHCSNGGPEAWLNEHADFERVFLVGESAGANIAHNLAMAAGKAGLGPNLGLLGVALVHSYFWGLDPIGSEALIPSRKEVIDRLWPFISPFARENDDPRINPVAKGASSLVELGYRSVLVCVAEKDMLRDKGWLYFESLGRSGWMGMVLIEETEGVDHAFI